MEAGDETGEEGEGHGAAAEHFLPAQDEAEGGVGEGDQEDGEESEAEPGAFVEDVEFGDGQEAFEADGDHEQECRQAEDEAEDAADPAAAELAEQGRGFEFMPELEARFEDFVHSGPALG
jgi:hypothetical protein